MDLKIQEQKLMEKIDLLKSTNSFFNFRMMHMVAKWQSLMKKIETNDDPDESLFDECIKLKKDIDSFAVKGRYEERLQKQLQVEANELQKQQSQNFKKILSQKLAKKLKHY